MLPYGALWKLDEMLHPTAPRGRRTLTARRRQALFVFVFGVVVCSLFLIPYHVTHLRRLSIRKANENLGFSVDLTNVETVRKSRRERLERVAYMLDAIDKDNEALSIDVARRLSQQWSRALYYDDRINPVPPNHLFHTEGYARQIAGLALYSGIVPTLSGEWRTAAAEPAAPTSDLVRSAFWPVQTHSPVTNAGCVRALRQTKSEAGRGSRPALASLFDRIVSSQASWHPEDMLVAAATDDRASEGAATSIAPPAWTRVALFLEAALRSGSDDDRKTTTTTTTQVLACENASRDALTTELFCVCACPRASDDDGPWSFSLVAPPSEAVTCTDTCACG